MSILVTGGIGYIGSHTCVELINNGYDLIVADNLSNCHPKVMDRIEHITKKRPFFYEMDIRDEKRLNFLFQEHSIDGVIHFAGLKSVAESVSDPFKYYDNNINSTLTLCKVMESNYVKKLVFSSSATVYSGTNKMPLTEDALTGNCTNPYGWTKFMCEQILRGVSGASVGWSILLLRYFNPIGAHESGLIGEDPAGIPNNLLPYISQTAVGHRESLSVFGADYDTEDGTGIRDYLHVSDLAKGHVAALKYGSSHTGVESFNLGTGRGFSVLQVVSAFERVNQVKIPYQIADRRPGDLAVCYADPDKAKRLLGWKAEKTLDMMCEDAWRWQKQNPNGYI